MEQIDTLDPNSLTIAQFAGFLRQTGLPQRLIELARDEDLGGSLRDWTGEEMFAPSDTRRVLIRSRAAGIIAGVEFLPDLVAVFAQPGEIQCEAMVSDGDEIRVGTVIAELSGNARSIVRLERTMLNLLSRMSGIATRTSVFVELVSGTNAKICDTRKTTPGLRAFEKYSVRCGGGTTHRMGLYDAILIKDNHLDGIKDQDLATRIASLAYKRENKGTALWFVQVEVDRLEQFAKVLEIKPGVVDMVLLDNMNPDKLAQAVRMRAGAGADLLLEASGGVSEDTARAIAESGVDRISIGGLTHQATSLDLGLDAP